MKTILLSLLGFLFSAAIQAASHDLKWDQNPGATGQNFYISTEPVDPITGKFPNFTGKSIGKVSEITVPDLTVGTKYYFAVTAVVGTAESAYSNVVDWIAGASPTPTLTPAPSPTASPSPTRTPTPSPSPARTPTPAPTPPTRPTPPSHLTHATPTPRPGRLQK